MLQTFRFTAPPEKTTDPPRQQVRARFAKSLVALVTLVSFLLSACTHGQCEPLQTGSGELSESEVAYIDNGRRLQDQLLFTGPEENIAATIEILRALFAPVGEPVEGQERGELFPEQQLRGNSIDLSFLTTLETAEPVPLPFRAAETLVIQLTKINEAAATLSGEALIHKLGELGNELGWEPDVQERIIKQLLTANARLSITSLQAIAETVGLTLADFGGNEVSVPWRQIIEFDLLPELTQGVGEVDFAIPLPALLTIAEEQQIALDKFQNVTIVTPSDLLVGINLADAVALVDSPNATVLMKIEELLQVADEHGVEITLFEAGEVVTALEILLSILDSRGIDPTTIPGVTVSITLDAIQSLIELRELAPEILQGIMVDLSMTDLLLIANEIGLPQDVFVETNQLLGFYQGLCTDPSGAEGDPGSVGAHPFGTTAITAGRNQFLRQWAFGNAAGIGIFNATAPIEPVAMYGLDGVLGSDAKMVVFDTQPYPTTATVFTKTIPVGFGDMALCVQQPPLYLQNESVCPADLSDHGLYVAGLAHTVAPFSEVTLIRVLNSDGKGNAFSLLDALTAYLKQQVLTDPAAMQKQVLNLSLGVTQADPLPPDLVIELNKRFEEIGWAPMDDNIAVSPALRLVLGSASYLGATVVAAAGNDSFDPTHPGTQQEPAIYPEVLGVMATGADGTEACYSNQGDLQAPGGNTADGGLCKQDYFTGCTANGAHSCNAGLISVVLDENSGSAPGIPPKEQYRYAYWAGTSFSTPLVSGLTARALGTNLRTGRAGDHVVVKQKFKDCDPNNPADKPDFASKACIE